MTRLVVFDVDGTLIDSQHVILGAMERAFAAIGRISPPKATTLSIVGLSLPEAMRALAPELPEPEIAALVTEYRACFAAGRARGGAEARAPLYHGARAALERLAARGTVLGLATGKARRGLDHAIGTHDLHGFFATLQTADDHPSKPHPSMLRRALAETGCAAEEAVMVGDTAFDIAMGQAAGVATIGVAWGYHPRARLAAAGADRIIDGFDALDAAIQAVCPEMIGSLR